MKGLDLAGQSYHTIATEWNTGRLYQPATHRHPFQMIRARYVRVHNAPRGVVIFNDLSRGISGMFELTAKPDNARELQTFVMHHYDYNDYSRAPCGVLIDDDWGKTGDD